MKTVGLAWEKVSKFTFTFLGAHQILEGTANPVTPSFTMKISFPLVSSASRRKIAS
jgi:hypothetical protein